MLRYAIVIDEDTKQCDVGEVSPSEAAIRLYELEQMSLQEVEQAADGKWYLMGYLPADNLNLAKAAKLQEINIIYEQKASAVKIDTPDSEVLTWDIQKNEAEKWQADYDAATPFIDGLALARGIDRNELLQKVINKVKVYNEYMAALTGERQRYEDSLKAAATIDEVEAVVWEI